MRTSEGISIVVEDDGEGIPADALEKVFEPFWRGDASRSTGGSGLGLTWSSGSSRASAARSPPGGADGRRPLRGLAAGRERRGER